MTILEPLPAPPVAEDAAAPLLTPAPVGTGGVNVLLVPGHAHSCRCYWDFRECRWVCVPSA